MTTVYRIQKHDAELHGIRSLTSNDEELPGVFVFESLPEAYGCREWNQEEAGVELATIECEPKDLRHVGDYEGVLLKADRGTIVDRRPFATIGDCAKWLEGQIQ